MRLFISDLDGTIINNRTINDLDYQMLLRLSNSKDTTFVIATGRSYSSYSTLFKNTLIKPKFSILSNGSIILNSENEAIFKCIINLIDLKETLKNLKDINFYYFQMIITTFDKQIVLNDLNDLEAFIESEVEIEVYAFCLEERFKNISNTKTLILSLRDRILVPKVIMNNWYIDFLFSDTSKKSAIDYLCNLLNTYEPYVIGDSWNDIIMFETTSNSYTFKHSPEDVIKHARNVVDEFNQCGTDFFNQNRLLELNTERCLLREFKLSDYIDVFEYAKDTEVTKYLLWDAHKDANFSKQIVKEMYVKKRQDIYVYAIVLKSNNKCIGSFEVRERKMSSSCELGFVLNKEYWNKGIMTEILTMMKEYLINDLGYNRIEANHFKENVGSGKVMLNIGMKLEGTKIMSAFKNGSFVDECFYAYVR